MKHEVSRQAAAAALLLIAPLMGGCKARGNLDRTYIEKEVSAHQAVKDLLDQTHRSTQTDQIRKLTEDATPVVQQHLDRAQELQKQLTKTA